MNGKPRPTIGVTAAAESVSYGVWSDVPAVLSPASYVRAVQRAGGRPVLLLPDPEDAEDPDGVLGMIDALIVTGGAGDVDPALYGQKPHPETGPVQEERDAYETDKPHVPTSLKEARELLAASDVAREAFGEEVVGHYLNAARVEIEAFEAAVTDWERYRNFERL